MMTIVSTSHSFGDKGANLSPSFWMIPLVNVKDARDDSRLGQHR